MFLFNLDKYKFLLVKATLYSTLEEICESKKYAFPLNDYKILSYMIRRIILSDQLKCDPLEVSFVYNDVRKPFLLNSELNFNVSHSGKWFLIGITKNKSIGVDLEVIKNIPKLDSFIESYASPEQKIKLLKLESSEKLVHTHFDWCLKESFVKARGDGIKEDFTKLNYQLDIPKIDSKNEDYKKRYIWSVDNNYIPHTSSYLYRCYYDQDLVLSVTTIGNKEDTLIEEMTFLKLNPELSTQD